MTLPPVIASRLATPKPWQVATAGGILVVFVLLAPALTHLATQKKVKDTTALSEVGRVGQPWQPAVFPAVASMPSPRQDTQPRPDTPPPPPPAFVPRLTATPPTMNLAATGSPAKTEKAVDPEAAAIASPILVAADTGHASVASPHSKAEPEAADGATNTAISGQLTPTALSGYRASRIRHPGMTIEQGRVFQCHNATRSTSELAGFVKATVTYDVLSVDGTTVLIDRGSTLFGEIAHGMANGQERLFILWRQVWTPKPNLVRVTLNSPAADEMGEAGIEADINHHTWRKIGGALMLSGAQSLLSGVSGALSNLGKGNSSGASQQNNGLNFYQFQGQGDTLASQLLASTVNIPDTGTVDQGRACSVFLSGDLDFSSVYQLKRIAQ